MTVKELVELLRKYPNDLRVVVNGYEDGFDDVSPERISVINIQLDTQIHYWGGPTQRLSRFGERNNRRCRNCRGSGFSSRVVVLKLKRNEYEK